MQTKNMTQPTKKEVLQALEIIHSKEFNGEKEEQICLQIFDADVLQNPVPNYIMMAFRDVVTEFESIVEF